MRKNGLCSIRMRASLRDAHVSGAERIVDAGSLEKTASELIARAKAGTEQPDRITVTVDPLDGAEIRKVAPLALVMQEVADFREGRAAAKRCLERAGVSGRAANIAIDFLSSGPSATGGVMRGAMILDARTGERLEPDRERGVRASCFDWGGGTCAEIGRMLEGRGLTHFRTREALALATKVAHAPGIAAELCWSDAPDYVAGYVASPLLGYIRFPFLKETGDRRGGRVFFVHREGFDLHAFIRYLEKTPVLIEGSQESRPATAPVKSARDQEEDDVLFGRELNMLRRRGLFRQTKTVVPGQGACVAIDGKDALLFCSNDYLDLANHPALREAAEAAMRTYGFGAGASRLVSGTGPLHEKLEEKIARFKATEAALLFNSGYAANTGIIPAVAGAGDAIFSDSLNHASIIDGCRLSGAAVHVYRHRDPEHLELLLRRSAGSGKKLIVTDGVFSMDGDIAPLPELADLAGRYGALLMVDDAHATGVLGRNGRGTIEHFGMQGRVRIHIGTLGKALGSFGAFAAGGRTLIDYLRNRARSFIYSTALPHAVCAASLAALDVVEREPARRMNLWENRERFVRGLEALDIRTAPSETPVLPIRIGDAHKTSEAGKMLFKLGIFAVGIRPPTVPEGEGRIRVTVTAVHSNDDIDRAVEAFGTLKREGMC